MAGNVTWGFADGAGTSAMFSSPTGLAVDSAGTVYVADMNNHRVRKITSGGVVSVSTLAGSSKSGAADGTGSAASFFFPTSITITTSGVLYVADQSNHRLRRVTSAGTVSTLAGAGLGYAEGAASAARFNFPGGVAVSPSGTTLAVADTANHRIRKVALDGAGNASSVALVAGNGSLGLSDGFGAAVRFSFPNGVALDGSGNLIVVDTANHVLRKINIAGRSVTTLGAASQFTAPAGIVFDSATNTIYVADTGANKVLQVSIAGTLLQTFGSGAAGWQDTALAPTALQYSAPIGLLAANGTIYVADSGNHYIRGLTPFLETVDGSTFTNGSTFAGSRIPGYANGGKGTAKFTAPAALAVDGATVYVADTGNHRIRAITGGTVSTVAGSGVAGFADGTGTAAKFSSPAGIVARNGVLFVADTGNRRIRKIDVATGVVTTLAGNGALGNADGTGVTAAFANPTGLAFDAAADILYVADEYNQAIRVVSRGQSQAPEFVSPPAATFFTGVASTFTAAALSNSAVTYTVDAGSLSPGLSLTTAGAITGTPTLAGTFSASIAATNATTTTRQSFSGTVYGFSNPAINGTLARGTAFTTTLTSNLGSVVLFGISSGALPTGLVLRQDNGVVSGTPTVPGNYTGTFSVTDGSGTATQAFVLTVPGAPAFANPTQAITLLPGVTGTTTAPGFVASAYPAPIFSIQSGSLPPGLTLNGNGTLTGVATTAGTYTGTVLATNTLGSATQTFAIAVKRVTATVSTLGETSRLSRPGNVVADAVGNLYVADTQFHTILKTSSSGTFLAAIGAGTAGSADGSLTTAQFLAPQSLAFDSAGNLYVADTGNHTIRKITFSSATVTTLAGKAGTAGSTFGAGTNAQFNSPTGLAFSPTGLLYVADSGNHRICTVDSAGLVAPFAGSASTSGATDGAGIAAQLAAPTALAIDAAGNVYVADATNNNIRKIDSSGNVTTIGTFATAGVTLQFPTGVAVDGAGNLYVSDTGHARIVELDSSGGISVLAGNGTTGLVDGTAATARFNAPARLALDPQGNLLVADSGNNAIRRISVRVQAPPVFTSAAPAPTAITGRTFSQNITFSGFAATPTFSVQSGGALPPGLTLNAATGVISGSPTTTGFYLGGIVATGPEGNATQGFSFTVYSVPGFTSAPITLTPAPGDAFATTTLTATGFPAPTFSVSAGDLPPGISLQPNGVLSGSFIRSGVYRGKFRAANAAGSEEQSYLFRVEPPAPPLGSVVAWVSTVASGVEQFSQPGSVAVGADGSVYVADTKHNAIKKITPGGAVSVFAGTGAAGTADGDGSLAQFSAPGGVAMDASGMLFVADTGNHLIRRINADGTVFTVAGSGVAGFADGTGAAAQFSSPAAITVDAAGNLYVADKGDQRIRKIAPGGVVTTLAGSGSAGFADAAGAAAQFSSPAGIAASADGVVYVADTGNHRVRRVAADGGVSTWAGTGVAGYADAWANHAGQLSSPQGVTIDGAGNVFVGDTGNRRIRKITPAGSLLTLAGSGVAGIAGGLRTVAQFAAPTGVAVDGAGNVFVADRDNNLIRRVSAVVSSTAIDDFRLQVRQTTALAFDRWNNLYAGDRFFRQISKLTTSGQILNLAGYHGSPSGLAVDPVGNVYVADSNSHAIYKVAPDNTETLLAGGTSGFADGTGATARFNRPGSLALDASGNVFVGDYQNSAIRKITPAGVVSAVVPPGAAPSPRSIAMDPSGTLYFVDGNSSTIRRLAPNGALTTVAGSGAGTVTDGIGTAASFRDPSSIAIDGAGTIYVSDYGRVRQIDASGIVTDFSGSSGEEVVFGYYGSSRDLAVDPGGNVYVTNYYLNRVTKLVPSTTTTIAGMSASSNLIAPAGVAVNSSLTLYVADQGANAILKITAGVVSAFAGGGGSGFADGVSSQAQFNAPGNVCLDAAGNVYVADTGNHRIRKVAASGTVSTLAGTGMSGFADGAGNTAQFSAPEGIAIDSAGNVFVGDTGNHRIRKISPAGAVSTVAGTGVADFLDGAIAVARFASPRGVAVDATGKIYVADTVNQRIRVISSGTVSTLAGSGASGWKDAVGATAQFNTPKGLTIDAAGVLYVSDTGNRRIRRIDSSGAVTTLAGSGLAGSADGVAASAAFASPLGLAVDGAGAIYVADALNQSVRQISSVTLTVPVPNPSSVTASLTVGVPFQTTVTGSGGPPPVVTVQTGSLPPGLAMYDSGIIAGTPTAPGNFAGTLAVSNAVGTGTVTFTLNVQNAVVPPVFLNAPIAVTVTADGYTAQGPLLNQLLAASGIPAPTFSVQSGSLPTGPTLSNDGLLKGTVRGNGTYTGLFAATNAAGTVTQPFSFTILQPPASSGSLKILATALSPFTINFSNQLHSGYPSPTFTLVSGALPPGLTMDSAGNITGTPPNLLKWMTYSGTVRATNVAGSADVPFTIDLQPVYASPTFAQSSVTFNVFTGAAVAAVLNAPGYPVANYRVDSGRLPPGVTLDYYGNLLGAPVAPGVYTGVFVADNGVGKAYQSFTFAVTNPPAVPAFISAPLTTTTLLTVGVPALAGLQAGGYPAPTFSLQSGALPAGLALTSSGSITGTPTLAGTYRGVFAATNASGTATQSFTLTILSSQPPLTWTVSTAAVGAPFVSPVDVAVNASGVVFVTDSDTFGSGAGASKVFSVSGAGQVSAFAGSTQGYVDALGTAAKFNDPV